MAVRHRIVLLWAIALVVAACSPAGEDAPSTSFPEGTATAPSTAPGTQPETTEPPSTSTSIAEATGSTSDRPLAPDFTLELGDGGTYTLSEGDKPVYLVFWAEW